jgi:hypothetical protein
MIRTEWQADAEIAPLSNADQVAVVRFAAQREIDEATARLARVDLSDGGRVLWSGILASAQKKLSWADAGCPVAVR